MKRKKRTRECCPVCGGSSVNVEAWVDINDGLSGDWAGGEPYCNDCGDHLRMTCTVDVATNKCLTHASSPDFHDDNFKPDLTPERVDEELIAAAFSLLKDARDLLAQAGTPKSAQRVRLAISSVRGALSNARHRASAAKRGETRKRIKRAPKVAVQTFAAVGRA